jgi:hypothetical protein
LQIHIVRLIKERQSNDELRVNLISRFDDHAEIGVDTNSKQGDKPKSYTPYRRYGTDEVIGIIEPVTERYLGVVTQGVYNNKYVRRLSVYERFKRDDVYNVIGEIELDTSRKPRTNLTNLGILTPSKINELDEFRLLLTCTGDDSSDTICKDEKALAKYTIYNSYSLHITGTEIASTEFHLVGKNRYDTTTTLLLTPTKAPKPSHHGFPWWTIIVGAAILGLLIGLYFWIQKRKRNQGLLDEEGAGVGFRSVE